MDRTFWTDERIDRAFAELRTEARDLRTEMHEEFRDVRNELSQLKLFMLGGLVTLLAAIIALHG